MSPLVTTFLFSVVLPAIITAVLAFLGSGGKFLGLARGQALIIALSSVLGTYFLLGRFSFPPSDISETLALTALWLAVYVAVAPKSNSGRYALRVVFVLIATAVLLWPLHESLANAVALRNLIAFICLAAGVWSIVDRASHQVSRTTLVVLPMISATALSILLMFSGSASFSQMVAILCGQLGALLVVSLVKPLRVSTEALVPFVSVFITLFMMCGHFYLDTNPWFMIYLCWPFLLLWVRPYLPIAKSWWMEAGILALFSALPLGYFVWVQFQSAGPLY